MKQAPVINLANSDLTPSGEVFCPHPKANMQTWNTHPRVFMPLADGQAKCPYCGTEYRLATPQGASAPH